MEKIIVIAGIKRSGSTWMFNVVRLMCDLMEWEVTIIKEHNWKPDLAKTANHVFTSRRIKKDIKKSLTKFYSSLPKDAPAKRGDYNVEQMLITLEEWNVYSEYCMEFEDVGTLKALEHIGDALGFTGNTEKLLYHVNAIKPPTDKSYDPETYLFSNHITSKK